MDPNLEENDIPNLCFIHKCALVSTLLLTQFYHPIEDTETANQIRDLTVAILTYDIDNIKFTNNPIQDAIALVTATNLIVILPFNTELHQRPQHLDIPYYQYL
ncbi:MAG TPA: hypothetical protein PK957_05240 [Candidatus Dojkabacteria bacterium]|nr:hypothetical protein [Candidatus Dojkabacteria bacterium]HQF36369.1 hypothetical protein [Candidatus Dojkabacteria bacterium]